MTSDADHLRLRELLPWLANGTLAPADAEPLRRHLAHCAACRAELAQCTRLAAGLQARDPGWHPSPAHRARVLAAIDGAEGRAAAPAPRDRPGAFERWLGWLTRTPRPLRLALALQAALIAVLGLALVWPLAEPRYETLSQGEGALPAHGVALRVVFDDAITERERRQLLLAIGGQIVAGPSALGVYTVRLDASDATKALALLHAHRQVRLAEPLDARGPR
jgi:anti-sigma factor RsiW